MFAAGATLSLLSWLGFYAASSKRVPSARLASLPARGWLLRGAAIGLALLALVPFSTVMGFERGIVIWLGVLTLAGVAFAFTIETHPKLNRICLWVSAASAPILLTATLLG